MTILAFDFTPAHACAVIVTATFESQLGGTPSYWYPSTGGGRLRMLQNGVVMEGPLQAMTTDRLKYTMQHQFDVAAGLPCTASLIIFPAGDRNVTAWNIALQVEQIKR